MSDSAAGPIEEEDPRRGLPSVESLVREPGCDSRISRWGRPVVLDAIRAALREAREAGAKSGAYRVPSAQELMATVDRILEMETRPGVRRVLNGTGVVLHTNLGRAPLAEEALAAIATVAAGYANLEYDLGRGQRGDRYSHCVRLLQAFTESEDALVVNNNAAAVALTVNELSRGREVIVSRGELVEIGGSFRIPDVVERAGGFLVEVGTTNRTRLSDYRRAITPSTGMLLKVHPSNYRLVGFTEEVNLAELTALGREAGIPVVHDLGSGQMVDALAEGLPAEPHPRDSSRLGVDVVTWSADKLLGGPQAGIVHGKAGPMGRLRENPLLRALRVDKMTIAGLEATLQLYRDPERVADRVPALRMLRESTESVRARARAALENCPDAVQVRVRLCELRSAVGGGTLPGVDLASAGWSVVGFPCGDLHEACRQADPPLVGRIDNDTFVIDFRTILAGEEGKVAAAVEAGLKRLQQRGEGDG